MQRCQRKTWRYLDSFASTPHIHVTILQTQCVSQSAFSQIALALRSDQYTLKQRLQAEEHARNLAEENVQLELTRGRETLEVPLSTASPTADARMPAHVCPCASGTEGPVFGQQA